MPLPDGGEDYAWPPDDLHNTYGKFREHAAWYSGDVQELASVYTGMNAPGAKPHGLVNVVRAWFWGKQAIAPATRIRIHAGMGADISSTSSDLLFSKPWKFEAEGDGVQARLEEIIEAAAFSSMLLEGGEIASALGGVYMRASWDKEISDKPIISLVHADGAVPEFRYGRLVAVTFWDVVLDGDGAVFRHLERHEPGVVWHGLYKGTTNKLGAAVPLADMDATAELIPDSDNAQATYANNRLVIETGIDRITAVYVPNMKPNRLYRASSQGRSDYMGAEVLMDALDETFTSWQRDLRLGRGRIIVAADYMRTNPASKGQGGWFDIDQEVFAPLDGMNPADGGGITLNQFKIRTTEHADTAKSLIERIVSVAGYSASSFGLEGDKEAQTATEIESRERRSFITRDKKAQYWAPAIRDILSIALDLDQYIFNGPGSAKIKVTYPEGVREDATRRATAIELLSRAKAASTETLVRMANPDWSPGEVTAEAKKIQDENGANVPDITSFVKGGAQPKPGEQPQAK